MSHPSGTGPARRRILDPIREFLRTESAGGFALVAATLLALIWANSPWAGSYFALWHRELDTGPLGISEDYQHWVNDGLMAVFFFVVALEIKRELVEGELRNPRAAALPIALALGGMVVPAGIFAALTLGTPEVKGWAIPMATDIAFAAAVLAIAGKRAGGELRLILLSLAIVDDLGAILVIALFYSSGISLGWLGSAALVVAAILGMRRLNLASPWAYLLPALLLWYCTFRSGVHATLAGVALGLLTPSGNVKGREPLRELEHRLHPLSSYLVLPLFALANAGVALGADQLRSAFASPLTWAVLLGLFAGKPLGVLLAGWAAVRLGVSSLPSNLALKDLLPIGLLAGIGFTVSLFIAGLSFTGEPLEHAKAGILLGSLLSACAGVVALKVRARAAAPASG
ncbi:MAG TPA: Na+/H+ antiporter NhaA [Actinomycetota bacterium]|nr:Na+/H+ antiporter NhaA [Actinomycetota bacterium]